tara:strand:- start:2145 stop:3227 length:1083 start_codon:yes stop_codon:yes gene_type:complete
MYNLSNISNTVLIKSSVRDYQIKFPISETIKINSSPKDIVLVDQKVFDLYPKSFKNCRLIKINAIESEKEYTRVGNVVKNILELGFTKNNKLIAVGGGITQDICGFVSSMLFRGVEWHFYPTTLLSQGDSCVGGKTSINFGDFKNQLGNFNPPKEVVIYSQFLETLPIEQIRSGIGELLHFYLISGKKDLDFFIERFDSRFKNIKKINELTKRNLSIKKRYVEIDEFDKNERLVFNYGHTFGHAIESITKNKIPHGLAVCMGVDVANYISFKKGYIDKDEYHVLRKYCKMILGEEGDWKGVEFPDIDIAEYMEILKKDKKNINHDKIMCVLTKGVGNMFLEEVEVRNLRGYIEKYKHESV